MSRHRILVVDDDPVVRFAMCDFLRGNDYIVAEAATIHEARLQLQSLQPDAVLLDVNLPDGSAGDLLQSMQSADLVVPVGIMKPAESSISIAGCYKGPTFLLARPVELPALDRQLTTALESERMRRQSQSARCKSRREIVSPFLGTSAAIRRLEQLSHRLLTSDSPILIQGETGSGKGVLANWLHRNGTRSSEEFHDLNCAGLSRELLETELFGHRKGSFTGALENKVGLFEAANHGTLFLDEIGDIDLLVQSKLLKVLEEQRFRRLGEVRERSVDVRLISATRCDLEKLVADSKFRVDLYYRINVVQMEVPALRDRLDDIPLLAPYMVERVAHECGRKPLSLERSAIEALQRHSWPGNIRELRNVIERAVQFSDRNTLTWEDFDFERRGVPRAPALTEMADCRMTLKQLEEIYIDLVLQSEGGSVERAARRLGIARSSLYNKIKPSSATEIPSASA